MKSKTEKGIGNKKISFILVSTVMVNLISGISILNIPAYAAGLADSKVLDLKFDGNITDSSANNISSTLNGTATYVTGESGQAISLNGTNNYIDLGTSAILQPANLTTSFWVKPDATMTGEQIIVWNKPNGKWNGNGWYLTSLSDTVPLKLSTGTGVQESYISGTRSTFFPVGQWTHIAVTYDSATRNVAIYRNGIAQTVSYTQQTGSVVSNNTDHKYLGFNSPNYGGSYAKINLDEFKIYSAAATTEEIRDIYRAESGTIIDEGIAQLDLDAITLPAETRGNLNFPIKGDNGSIISWESKNTDVISNTGGVTAKNENTTVKINATATYGTASKSKVFTVTVKRNVISNVEFLKQFDMQDVSVTDPYYINDYNKDMKYLLSLDADRLLAGFREVAGLSKEADVYGGWENTMIKGHTMGHYMSAIAQAYKQTKEDSDLKTNTDLKKQIDHIINGLEVCQNASNTGYLFATPEKHFDIIEGKATGGNWVPWYTMHKIIAGLIDVYKYEGNEKALDIASKLGDWIYNRTSKWNAATQTRVLNVEYGGMNDCLYELYKITKNQNHLAAAHKFDENSLFTNIANGKDVLTNVHANTTIPKLIGALNRYRTLGEDESFYLTAAEKFWDMVINDHTYVTGGNSENEHFRAAGQLDSTRNNINCETCNSYNMLKLSRELFKITGDVKYANFYEKSYINEIMSSMNPETGMTTYFKSMGTGYFKVFGSETNHFWCCTGTGMENFTKLNDSLYYHTDNDLYVNAYLSSKLNWTEKGLKLTQEANLPESNKATFTIKASPSQAVNIKFRAPEWIAKGQTVTVVVNGETLDFEAKNGYIDVNRIWRTGDKVELILPMEVQVSRLPDNNDAVAFTYGPVVLSAGLGTEDMKTSSHGIQVLKATIPSDVSIKDYIIINNSTVDKWINNIKDNLVKTEGKVEFTLRNTDEDNNLKFTPHYQRYTDRYGIYFDLAASDSPIFQDLILDKKAANKKANATIDKVQITNDQHELAHNLQGNSEGGTYGGYKYRHANLALSSTDGAGWLSYDMAVNPSITNYLCVKYYSGDAGRTFNIYADGQLLKAVTLESKSTTGFYDVLYEIPADCVSDKTVTIKFANRGRSFAGGIFDTVSILKNYDTNPDLASVSVDGTMATLTGSNYEISVPTSTTAAAVKFTPANANDLVYVDGILIDDTVNRNVALGGDTTTLNIRVVAEDDTTKKAYTVTIKKQTESSSIDEAISAANTAIGAVIISTDGSDVLKTDKWVTKSDVDKLKVAIEIAKLAKTTVTTTDKVKEAATTLNRAVAVFNQETRAGQKTASIVPAAVELTRNDNTLTGILRNEDGSKFTTDAAVKYEWYRNNKLVEDENSDTYKLSANDKGKQIGVKVVLYNLTSKDVYISDDSDDDKVPENLLITRDDNTLTAILKNEDGSKFTTDAAVKYEWYRGNKLVEDRNSYTYDLSDTDKGTSIKVKVPQYGLKSESINIPKDSSDEPTPIGKGKPVEVRIEGTEIVGDTLEAQLLSENGVVVTTSASVTYEWYRLSSKDSKDGKLVGTDKSYKLVDIDEGKYIKLVATCEDKIFDDITSVISKKSSSSSKHHKHESSSSSSSSTTSKTDDTTVSNSETSKSSNDESTTIIDGWKNNNDNTWIYNEKGQPVSGWKQIGGTWYLMDSTGIMQTGWKQINDTWYFLKESGAMATGWVQTNGKWYYLYSDGAMASNTIIDGYTVDESGAWVK